MNRDEMREASRECWNVSLSCTAKMWRAIKRGHLSDKRGLPCADCGRTATVNEHRNYNKWWEVEPVCHPCNVKRGRAAPYRHLPFSTAARTPRFTSHHEQCIGQFAASMFHVNDEECADLAVMAGRLAETSEAAE